MSCNPIVTKIDKPKVIADIKRKEINVSLAGIRGATGATGAASGGVTFETTSKNLESLPYTLNYTGDVLTSIVYTTDTSFITKTLGYVSDRLESITLSGDTPSEIDLIKTLSYTGDALTGVSYS